MYNTSPQLVVLNYGLPNRRTKIIMLTIHDEYEWNFMIIAKKHLFTKIKMMLIKGIWNPPKLNLLEK